MKDTTILVIAFGLFITLMEVVAMVEMHTNGVILSATVGSLVLLVTKYYEYLKISQQVTK